MKQFVTDSNYHQFYVADRVLEPDAPTAWTEEHVLSHHLTEENIAALQTDNDIDARVICCGPDDPIPDFPDVADFEVRTKIHVPSKKVGIYGWPWELEDEYQIDSDMCEILFRGYAINQTDENGDYYLVKIAPLQNKTFECRPLQNSAAEDSR